MENSLDVVYNLLQVLDRSVVFPLFDNWFCTCKIKSIASLFVATLFEQVEFAGVG